MDISTLIIANPKTSIVIISFTIALIMTILSALITNKQLLKDIKEKQKRLREEMKQHKDNPQKMMEINKQMMEDFPKQMKESMKISLVTMIPLLFLFGWLRGIFSQTAIAGNWIWWYIVGSLVFSMFFRKVFKLD
ncbi:MAG: EMC3/TMCO1 family protein [archaeon]|nr:EMC3/TMCO1 family protein [archaeon]